MPKTIFFSQATDLFFILIFIAFSMWAKSSSLKGSRSVWYENLLTIAQKTPDVPLPLLEHISKLESTQLPTIAASEMSLQQTEMAFGIKEATGTQPWMVPHLFFALPADFGKYHPYSLAWT
jgi:hypothetical protein